MTNRLAMKAAPGNKHTTAVEVLLKTVHDYRVNNTKALAFDISRFSLPYFIVILLSPCFTIYFSWLISI
jgi:hypothetical protein